MLPEFKPQSNYYSAGPRPDNIHALRAAFYNQALTRFNRARSRAMLRRMWCSLVKTPNCLQELQTISAQDYAKRHYGGLQPVALDQISGTLGRSEWFDAQFYSLTEQVRERWLSIAMAHLMFVPLDPVQLIQMGGAISCRMGATVSRSHASLASMSSTPRWWYGRKPADQNAIIEAGWYRATGQANLRHRRIVAPKI